MRDVRNVRNVRNARDVRVVRVVRDVRNLRNRLRAHALPQCSVIWSYAAPAEFGLVPSLEDLKPLQPVVDSLMQRDLMRYGPASRAAATSAASSAHTLSSKLEEETTSQLSKFLDDLPSNSSLPRPSA